MLSLIITKNILKTLYMRIYWRGDERYRVPQVRPRFLFLSYNVLFCLIRNAPKWVLSSVCILFGSKSDSGTADVAVFRSCSPESELSRITCIYRWLIFWEINDSEAPNRSVVPLHSTRLYPQNSIKSNYLPSVSWSLWSIIRPPSECYTGQTSSQCSPSPPARLLDLCPWTDFLVSLQAHYVRATLCRVFCFWCKGWLLIIQSFFIFHNRHSRCVNAVSDRSHWVIRAHNYGHSVVAPQLQLTENPEAIPND